MSIRLSHKNGHTPLPIAATLGVNVLGATDIYVRISSYFLSFQNSGPRADLFLSEVYCSEELLVRK